MIHIWLEKITSIKFLSILLFRNDKVVFYETATRLGKLLIRISDSFSKPLVQFSQYDFQTGVKDKSGKALFYQVQKEIDYLSSKFLNDAENNNWLPNKYKNYSDEWLRILKTSLIFIIREKIMFISAVENFYDKGEISSVNVSKIILYSKHFPTPIRDSYRFKVTIPFEIKLLPSFKYYLLFYPIPGLILHLLLKSLLASVKRRPKWNVPVDVLRKGCIFEQYNKSMLKRYPHSGHLYWFPHSGLAEERVVFYFDREDSPCNNINVSEIESYNFSWINMQDSIENMRHPVKMTIKCLRNAVSILPKKWNEIDIWVWINLVYYSIKLESFREIFRKYKVRALHQHIEWTPDTILKSLAMRMENGIMIWNHWSIDRFPIAWVNCGLADLVFSWGHLNDGYFNAHNFSYKYLVQTGMVAGDNIESINKLKVQEVRAQFSRSVDFIITLLDSTYAKNVYHSSVSMLIFYEKILKSVLNQKNWALLIKSKGYSLDRLPYREAVHGVIERLERQGRCVRLDSANTRVSFAASVGDVTICYGTNSAGIIAALVGKKVLHWDLPGCLEHPLYYLGGENKVVFKSYHKLLHAMEEIAIGNSILGDHSEWLYLFNAFQNNQGNMRAGQLVGNYIAKYDSGMSSDIALRKAIAEYAARWGKDKISTPGKIQNHLGNDLWQQVMKNI